MATTRRALGWTIHADAFWFDVRCGGEVHRVGWRRGRLLVPEHDLASEDVFVALGGEAPGCVRLARALSGRVPGRVPEHLADLVAHARAARSDLLGAPPADAATPVADLVVAALEVHADRLGLGCSRTPPVHVDVSHGAVPFAAGTVRPYGGRVEVRLPARWFETVAVSGWAFAGRTVVLADLGPPADGVGHRRVLAARWWAVGDAARPQAVEVRPATARLLRSPGGAALAWEPPGCHRHAGHQRCGDAPVIEWGTFTFAPT